MEAPSRPNPDELLERIKKQEAKLKKGRLKIYFGMCAGVGKTYAMLQDAGKEAREGKNVLIGYVETHKRKETEALLEGLTILPRKKIVYNNVTLEEMDTDAILEKKPELVIIDELAHTNAPTSRHNKRHLDVLEILNKGINVFTTLNVQHLESRADTVAQISGSRIRETVPDSILEAVDEIELVDISPEELIQRLKEGKVYKGEQSQKALENFFKKGNLTALREMSLRLTADRVDKQLRDYMQEKRISGPWKSGQRILIAIRPGPYSAHLIKWARNIAYTMEATWLALYVETSKVISDEEKKELMKNFELAKELGADIMTTSDEDIVKGILRIAKQENATQIVIGKSRRPYLFSGLFSHNITDRLIKESGNIDIYIVGTDPEESHPKRSAPKLQLHSSFNRYLITSTIVSLVAAICYPLSDIIGYQTAALVLLLAVAFLPLFFGPGPVLTAAALSAVLWDYFFIPPKFTFSIGRIEDILMFCMYFIIAFVTSIQTTRIRARERIVRQRESHSVALFNLANDLSKSHTLDEVLYESVKNLKSVFDTDMAILLADSREILFNTYVKNSEFRLNEKEFGVATWVYKNNKKAGQFTDTLPYAEAQYFPLTSPRKIYGVLGIKFKTGNQQTPDKISLLENFVKQIGVAIEREILNENATRNLIIEESEKLYKNLFNSISHELKTPLAAIMSISNYLLENSDLKASDTNKQMLKDISTASTRLNRLVENLLDMTRIESGRMELNLKWFDVRDLINSTLKNLYTELSAHNIHLDIPRDTHPVKIDFVLMEQVIKNILINACVYTPAGTDIYIKTFTNKDKLVISISDNGPGIPDEHLKHIFDKFYRVKNEYSGGTGLGLSISKGFVEAHNGSITVKNKESGGIEFIIDLPQSFEEDSLQLENE